PFILLILQQPRRRQNSPKHPANPCGASASASWHSPCYGQNRFIPTPYTRMPPCHSPFITPLTIPFISGTPVAAPPPHRHSPFAIIPCRKNWSGPAPSSIR